MAPCWTRTPRLETAIEKGVTSEDEIAKRCPMGRAAEPEEVAKAILFMASEDAGFITGDHPAGGRRLAGLRVWELTGPAASPTMV